MNIDEQTGTPDTTESDSDDAALRDAELRDSELVDAERAADEAALEASKMSLGVERWVQLVFVTAAILFVWLFDHVIASIWYVFADPDESLVTAGAVVVGILATIGIYKQPLVYSTVHDTVEELSRVSWPTRKETSSSTIIVVVTSVVAALMLFLFDSVWSAVTDLVYKV